MIRSLEPTLAVASGLLWVMLRRDTPGRADADDALVDTLTTYVEGSHLGVWDGQSSGSGGLDISFSVPNQHQVALLLDRFLKQQYPDRSYAITDRYESFFDGAHADIIGCASALLVNARQQILFHLRDDIPAIAFPNHWAIPGGHIEADETAAQAIRRELREELDYTSPVEPCAEYLFWRTPGVVVHQFLFRGTITLEAHEILLHEGQGVRYFGRDDLDCYPIAFGFDRVCRAVWESICVP